MKNNFTEEFDIVVIGGGHAGCEAALASARLGSKTLMLVTDIESVAMMPCNPAIGGTGKGHLVREIDALGGEMGINIDKTFIQSRMLNTAKGPAVHSLRAQADKAWYHREMLKTIESQENLTLREEEAIDLLFDKSQEDDGEVFDKSQIGIDEELDKPQVDAYKDSYKSQDGFPRVVGVVTSTANYSAKAVVIATGTFLRGKIFIGESVTESGPAVMKPSNKLAESLEKCGLPMRRFKTGTPARAIASTFDYEKMQEQKGDAEIVPFSFMNEALERDQISCWLTYTNERTHEIIRNNFHRSALFGGQIEGIGPRYCPSIEDKVNRFSDKERHQLFIEPEGLETEEMYIQGMSSSLPEDVQWEFYHSISGLENIEITKPAYAIEYDCVDPLSLKPSLESKIIKNLFCAGQFNGSSGYEEAAAQGIMAGINANMLINGKNQRALQKNDVQSGI